MKEIQIKSKKQIIKVFFKNNILFRALKLVFNPNKLILKVKNINKKSKKNVVINWNDRTRRFMKYSVIDTQTPKDEYNYVTRMQKNFLFSNLKKFMTGKETNILDFGCGTGRFSEDLSKLTKIGKVLAVDTERQMIKLAKNSERVKYKHINSLSQIKGKFDVIFIANVFGGIEVKKLKKIAKFLISKLKKNGIFFLNENTDNTNISKNEILREWSSRSEKFYMKLFSSIKLKKIDEYRYLKNQTSIFIGKK